MDLLGDSDTGIAGTRVRHRHRVETSATDRMRTVAGVAVAGAALIGTASQVAPALAHAAPLLPSHDDKTVIGQDAPVEDAAVDLKAATQVAAQTPEAATPSAEPIAAPDANPAPFGLQNLPPEVSAPLAQAEQVLKDLQQKFTPSVAVKPVNGVLTSGFGARWGTMHYGIDFADPIGTPIKSVMGGTVIDAGPASGFGLWVRVKQDDGTTAVYGHVNDMYVTKGQRVNTGDVIASVGNRGNSTGPHLHLEIWDAADNKMDPLPWLASKGVLMQQQWGPDQ